MQQILRTFQQCAVQPGSQDRKVRAGSSASSLTRFHCARKRRASRFQIYIYMSRKKYLRTHKKRVAVSFAGSADFWVKNFW